MRGRVQKVPGLALFAQGQRLQTKLRGRDPRVLDTVQSPERHEETPEQMIQEIILFALDTPITIARKLQAIRVNYFAFDALESVAVVKLRIPARRLLDAQRNRRRLGGRQLHLHRLGDMLGKGGLVNFEDLAQSFEETRRRRRAGVVG
ncbi:MAG: hypothetical protein AAFO91_00050 [Bacteroidota bacterium]